MLQAVRYVAWALTRLLVWLRYHIRVDGLEQLRDLPRPVLVLPNHPAYIDPVLVITVLWPYLRPRPLLYEGYFQNPFLYPVMKVLNALRVPDLERPSAKARARAQEAIASVIEGLRRGESEILWPAGHVQHDGVERLGGARAVAEVLRAVPEASVVLVRTRGLWGSMFSYAATGSRPNLLRKLLTGAGLLLSNLLLFTPRRPVTITLERLDRGRLPELRREELNPWLEKWYNNGDAEKPTFVPYHFLFGRRHYEFPSLTPSAGEELGRVAPQTKAEVGRILARRLRRPLTVAEQQPETPLDRLGFDSLDRMQLTLDVEQRFGFSGEEAPASVGELWLLAQGLAGKGPTRPAPAAWFRPPAPHPGPLKIRGATLAEAFVSRALANPGDVAAADDLAGVVTAGRLLTGALVLARRFAELPGANVGLLLPASVAADTAFLALHLAGKLPVLLNWTTGPAHLAYAARTTALSHVVTSNQFIDRTGIEVEGTQYMCLEDVRRGIGRLELLRTLWAVRLLPGRIRRRIPQADPDQPAVVLFTSGSEKAPKAVPLTHRNLLTDEQACIDVLSLTRSDALLGFLPAFHSFGLSVTALLPLLSGLRVVHHPDPTASAGLARKIAAYKPTLLAGTPTFVSPILERAEPEDLASLRLIVVGAEKCPPALFDLAGRKVPRATLLEGYGITECAPVVAANRPGGNRPGTLGRPLPGVDVCVVDLETGAPLPPGREGMLLVSGSIVFPGYLNYDGPQPFRELGGKRWFVTGDLARLDADGFIHFAGRLARFLKAGGEMISLPALEEPFARRWPPTDKGPRVAVEGVDSEGSRRIVLFTTEPIDLTAANELLLQEGFRGVLRLDEVRHVPAIPVLGTGKTDYKELRKLITAADSLAPA